MPLHLLRRANLSSPICVTYHWPLITWRSPFFTDRWKSPVSIFKDCVPRFSPHNCLARRIFSRHRFRQAMLQGFLGPILLMEAASVLQCHPKDDMPEFHCQENAEF